MQLENDNCTHLFIICAFRFGLLLYADRIDVRKWTLVATMIDRQDKPVTQKAALEYMIKSNCNTFPFIIHDSLKQ